jgi:hypothetical protein
MPMANPKAKAEGNLAVVEDVDIAMAVRIVAHGGRFYLSVRPRDIGFWDLKVGDEVLVKITKVKRVRGSALEDLEG